MSKIEHEKGTDHITVTLYVDGTSYEHVFHGTRGALAGLLQLQATLAQATAGSVERGKLSVIPANNELMREIVSALEG